MSGSLTCQRCKGTGLIKVVRFGFGEVEETCPNGCARNEQLTMEPVVAVAGSATPQPPSRVSPQSYREAVNQLLGVIDATADVLRKYGLPATAGELTRAAAGVRAAPTPEFGPAHNGRATSRNAALMNKPTAGSQRDRVLLAIQGVCSRGFPGLTDEEIESITHMKHQTASARRRELVIGGFIKDSGQTKTNESGAQATLWVIA